MIRRRRGTTRYVGDLIDEVLDRVSDVEHDLRRAASTAVEERNDDWNDDDWERRGDWDRRPRRGDWDDCDDWGHRDYDDDLDEIIDELIDLRRRLRRGGRWSRRRGPFPPFRVDRGDELGGQVAHLNRAVEGLAQQIKTMRPESEPPPPARTGASRAK